jgi:hypothetical protein
VAGEACRAVAAPAPPAAGAPPAACLLRARCCGAGGSCSRRQRQPVAGGRCGRPRLCRYTTASMVALFCAIYVLLIATWAGAGAGRGGGGGQPPRYQQLLQGAPPPPFSPSSLPSINISTKKQLFLSTDLLKENLLVNVSLTVHRPRELTDLPVFHVGHDAMDAATGAEHIWAYNSLVDDGKRAILYYDANRWGVRNGTEVIKYNNRTYFLPKISRPDELCPIKTLVAVSTDSGLSWKKPSLGLVEYNGSTTNNIVWPKTTCKRGSIEIGGAFLDTRPGVPAREKFKLMMSDELSPGKPPHGGYAVYALGSADGMNWTQLAPHPSWALSDTQNVVLWHPGLGKYVAYRRDWGGDTFPDVKGREKCSFCVDAQHCGISDYPPVGRYVGRAVSDDITNFTEAKWATAFRFDHLDSPCTDVGALMYW